MQAPRGAQPTGTNRPKGSPPTRAPGKPGAAPEGKAAARGPRQAAPQLSLPPRPTHCRQARRPPHQGTPRPGDHRAVAPPGPMPNPEVKRRLADDSASTGRAKVGRRQDTAPGGNPKGPRPGALLLPGAASLGGPRGVGETCDGWIVRALLSRKRFRDCTCAARNSF